MAVHTMVSTSIQGRESLLHRISSHERTIMVVVYCHCLEYEGEGIIDKKLLHHRGDSEAICQCSWSLLGEAWNESVHCELDWYAVDNSRFKGSVGLF
jgi:hypothetical protein